MLSLTTHTSENCPRDVAEFCADNLCRNNSEMQQSFRAIAAGRSTSAPDGIAIAVATTLVNDEPVPIGWASIYHWNGAPSVQGVVFPNYRRRGLASALVSALTFDGRVPLAEANVFSPHFVSVAKRAGFSRVIEWKLVDDGWIKCSES